MFVLPNETKPMTANDTAAAEGKMAASIKKVLRVQAFFATVLLSLEQRKIEDGTMAVGGGILYWCAAFVLRSCASTKVTFIVLHEVLHVILKHGFRRGWRDPRLWNNACDLKINMLIVRLGAVRGGKPYTDVQFRAYPKAHYIKHALVLDEIYRMPEDGLLDPSLWGMSEEDIYDALVKENAAKNKPENEKGEGEGEGESTDADADADATGAENGEGQGDCPWGNFDDAKGEDGKELTEDEAEKACKELDKLIKTAETVAKGRGQMPGLIGEAVIAANTPSQDWQDVIENRVANSVPMDVNYNRPNRMYAGTSEVILPSSDTTGVGTLAIYADASGSVSGAEFSQFMGDILDICDRLQPERVIFIQFDSKAGEPEEIDRGDIPKLERRHNGGTRFSAPFKKVVELGIEEEIGVAIVFTDGGDNEYPKFTPEYPVIWASTGQFCGGPPPFGEVVGVKFKKD